MNAHTRKTYEAILGSPAPRNIAWDKFVDLWQDIADSVDSESGDRLAVQMNGHRVVFRRPHDGRVSIQEIEDARHLIRATPDPKGAGTIVAVAIDAKQARILEFDLDTEKVTDTEHDIHDPDPRSRHLRTVERHTGREDIQELKWFFDEIAEQLSSVTQGRKFVVLGHGHGKSDVAAEFVERLQAKHHALATQVAAVADIDLSAATDAQLETKVQQLAPHD